MKRLALVAALAVLPACTTFHEDRRTLTTWNLELIKDNAVAVHKPCDSRDWDGFGNAVVRWVCVEPFALVMLPVSWLGDTLVLNPIDGWKKAEIQTYNRRFGYDDSMGAAESANKNWQLAPGLPPEPVPGLIAVPEFLGHFLWNSLTWTDPVNTQSWNDYWNEHHEQAAR